MNKVKQPFTILFLVLIIATFFGCNAQKNTSIDVDKLAQTLSVSVKFNDQLSKLDEKATYKIYNVQNSDVKKQSVYVGSGATAEEISVWEGKDADSAKRIKSSILSHIETQKAAFQSYAPAEMPKLKNPVLVCEGNYVILCLSNDNTKAEQVIDSILKQ